MSILIKGMEMPKNCKDCPFSDHEAWCLIPGSWRERYYCPDDERSEHCPLIELPPHGRLIDIKSVEDGKFVTVGNDYQRWWNGALESVIDNAPTVIEGSET